MSHPEALTPAGVHTHASRYRGIAFALLATLLWSTTGLFIGQLVTIYHLSPVAISAWRALLVALALLVWTILRRPAALRITPRMLPFYLAYGLIGVALFNVAWSWSVQVNRPAVATALVFCAPIFVALGDRLFFRV